MNYSELRSSSEDAAGNTSHTEGRDFTQTYSLDLRLALLPTLTLNGSGQFMKDEATLLSGAAAGRSVSEVKRPSAELTFRDPYNVYSASAGYSETEYRQWSGTQSTTYYTDGYSARLGWKPDAFPSVIMLYSRTDNHDADRTAVDLTTDAVSLTTRYAPDARLGLAYTAGYTDTRDLLGATETHEFRQSASATYADQYFERRMLLNSSVNLNADTMELSREGTGAVSYQLFPFAGLTGVTDTPLADSLAVASAVIDGNLVAPAGIDIGSSLIQAGDSRLREIAVDLYTPQTVDTVLVWVDRQLSPDVASSFAWEVYISSDNSTWTLHQTVPAATFGPFQNRFSIALLPVAARYLKVATRPLSPAVNGALLPANQNIFVTEMQVFSTSSQSTRLTGRSRQVAEFYNLGLRTQLLSNPSLYHDFNLTAAFNQTSTGSTSSVDVSNGLSSSYRFNRVYSGTARIAMDNRFGHGPTDSSNTSFTYNAALTAAPYRTLTNSLVYSGSRLIDNQRTSENNSVFFSSTAQLYRGVSANASGGISDGRSENNGVVSTTRTETASAGSSLAPRRDLSMSMLFSASKTESTGALTAPAGWTDRWNVDIVYRPFPILYFTAGWEGRSDWQPRVIQHYSVTGSPYLAGGNLQLSFVYTEIYNSDNRTFEKIVGPNMEWRLTPRSTLSSSYETIRVDSTNGRSDVASFNVTFRVLL